MCSAGKVTSCDGRVRSDPRLIERVGRDYAEHHGVYPLRRVGALTLVAAWLSWRLIEAPCLRWGRSGFTGKGKALAASG